MRVKNFLLIYPFAALLSCSPKPADEVLLKELNNGLASSAALAYGNSTNTIEIFKIKLTDPITKVKAELWYPKIVKVQEQTANLVDLIEGLKKTIEADLNTTKHKSVTELLIENGEYRVLYRKLKRYRQQILFEDSMRLNNLRSSTVIINKEQDTLDNENFLKQCLTSDYPYGTLAYLNLLKNNLTIAAARCITFYDEQIMHHMPRFDSFEAILGQNSQILKAGDSLEITGGAGSFSKRRLLGFSVDGKEVEPDHRGLAVYKFKTQNRLGNYSIPVHIRVLDEDSLEHTATFNVEYTLVDAIKKH